MIIEDIYRDSVLKYPLTEEEYRKLDKVNDFLKIFRRKFIFVTDLRKYLIKQIRKKYTVEEFYEYELILNKLFWNLRWLLFPLWKYPAISEEEYERIVRDNYGNRDRLPYSLLLCSYDTYRDEEDLYKRLANNPIFKSVYYRSFINKLVIVDKKNRIIMTKPIEGSPFIFSKNYFNLLTMNILFHKNLYEQVMRRPYSIKFIKIDLSEFYYEYDYGFPNLNYCTYDFGTKEQKMDRIRKMYFNDKSKKKWWFKLMI